VKDVYASSVENDSASVITVVNAVASGTAGQRRSVDSYIQLDLLKVRGAWRVESVTNLNFGQGTDSGTGASGTGGTTGTTTVPPTTPSG
jgi:hypothetical protein